MILTPKLWKGSIPKRLIVALMIFVACLTSFMLRASMSINLLAMVQPSGNTTVASQAAKLMNSSTNSSESPLFRSTTTMAYEVTVETNDSIESTEPKMMLSPHNYGARYEWDQQAQSRILGAYFYGYLFTSLPAGLLAERYGPKLMISASFIASAIITAFTPFLASIGAWYVFGSRALIGVLAGLVYPAFHNLISRWIPPNERGKVVACISGGSTFGTVITWPVAGILTEQFGWVYAFYIPSLFVLVIGVVWMALIENSPAQHKTITAEEKQLIEESFGDTISKTKRMPPFKKVFTSLPYLSLLLLHYGTFWGMNFFITQAPRFMNEVLGFKLANAGILSSLPYVARMFSAFFFGYLGDLIRQKDLMSTTAIRKSFCLFSHLLPGVFLILLPYIAKDPLVCVALIVACLGFNGSSTITNLVNAQDLAPNFVATLYGIMNFVGTTAGFLAPMLVAHFTAEKSTMDEWKSVFLISAAMFIVSGVIFIVFGSGNVQKWNEIKEEPSQSAAATTNGKESIECTAVKRD